MRSSLFALVALAALGESPALAQPSTPVHGGFTASVGLGVGAGSGGVPVVCVGGEIEGCPDTQSPRHNAPAGYVRVGGAIAPNLVLAGELNAWSWHDETQASLRLTAATVNAVLQWYPRAASGFFLSGGLGYGRWQWNTEYVLNTPAGGQIYQSIELHTNGLGYQAGLGYDVPLGHGLSLTPYATFFGATNGSGEEGGMIGTNVVQGGIGLTWH
jgi:autotransporter-like protein